jgi:2,3-bisphosphoglycerate-independent phosphoglycerate mutase
MSVMGCDPKLYYTGRSPLEAISMGIALADGDVTYRVNLVTLSGEKDFSKKTMLDYSGGEIETAEAAKLIALIRPLVPAGFELFSGVSYRHCLVERKSTDGAGGSPKKLTPPHNITNQKIKEFLPTGGGAEKLLDFMHKAHEVLAAHPDNRTKANAVWVWGEGTKPTLPDFKAETGLSGAVISAVDLVKGIGLGMKLQSIDVAGATGTLSTDFDGKAAAAIDALKTHDYVYVHIEAPDECGHQGDAAGKQRAIELIDEKVVGPIFAALQGAPFKMLILPDHATPLSLRTHTSDPVPYILYDSTQELQNGVTSYTEAAAKETGVIVESGTALFQKMLSAPQTDKPKAEIKPEPEKE